MNLLKKHKTLVISAIVTILGFGAWIIYQYVFSAPLSTNEIAVEYQGTAEEFKQWLQTDFEQWNNKIVQIRGTITEVAEEGILLNDNIYCQLENKPINIAKNDVITLKGRVIGHDELLEETKLNQCIITQLEEHF